MFSCALHTLSCSCIAALGVQLQQEGGSGGSRPYVCKQCGMNVKDAPAWCSDHGLQPTVKATRQNCVKGYRLVKLVKPPAPAQQEPSQEEPDLLEP